MASQAARPCCGHTAEASYDGYCTVLTCTCFCRSLCEHRKITVPGDARLAERTRGSPLWGFCRDCRAKVGDRHIRSLRPDRDPRAAIYWLGEPENDADDASESVFPQQDEALPSRDAEPASQLALFPTLL